MLLASADRFSLALTSPVEAYCPSQLTLLFQSTNAPLGLSRQAQTCNSKNDGMPKRFGASTKLNNWPSSCGGPPLAASQVAASTMYSTPTSRRALPTGS